MSNNNSNYDHAASEVDVIIYSNGKTRIRAQWSISAATGFFSGTSLKKKDMRLGNIISGFIKDTIKLNFDGINVSRYSSSDAALSETAILDHYLGKNVIIMHIKTDNDSLKGITGILDSFNSNYLIIIGNGLTLALPRSQMDTKYRIALSDSSFIENMDPYFTVYMSTADTTKKIVTATADYVSEDLSYIYTHHLIISKDGSSLEWRRSVMIKSKSKSFVHNSKTFILNVPLEMEQRTRPGKHEISILQKTFAVRSMDAVSTGQSSGRDDDDDDAIAEKHQQRSMRTMVPLNLPAEAPEQFPFYKELSTDKEVSCRYYYSFDPFHPKEVRKILRLDVKGEVDIEKRFFPGRVIGYKYNNDGTDEMIGVSVLDINVHRHNFVDLDFGEDNSVVVIKNIQDIEDPDKTKNIKTRKYFYDVTNTTPDKITVVISQRFSSKQPDLKHMDDDMKKFINIVEPKLEKFDDIRDNSLREIEVIVGPNSTYKFHVEELIRL